MDSAETEKLHDILEGILQCIVCYSCVPSNSSQCDNGHFVCKDCIQHVKHCPLCGSDKSLYESKLAARIAQDVDLRYKCPQGCGTKVAHSLIGQHLQSCSMLKISCPECMTLHDDTTSFVQHIASEHDSITIFTEHSCLHNVQNAFLSTDSMFVLTPTSRFHMRMTRNRGFGYHLSIINLSEDALRMCICYTMDDIQYQVAMTLQYDLARAGRSIVLPSCPASVENMSVLTTCDQA